MADGFTISPHSSEFGPSPRWVRVYFNQQLIADSKDMMLLRETNCLPLYYFPKKDVRMDCLQPSDRTAHSDRKGEGIFWHVVIGDTIAKDAAFTFQNPPGTGPKLEDYVAFAWEKMDAWFEEDEEIFVYARDPYKRVDVIQSSRHIKVVVDGVTVGETKRPTLLFETGLPTRYYMPKHDARMDLYRTVRPHSAKQVVAVLNCATRTSVCGAPTANVAHVVSHTTLAKPEVRA